MSIIFSVVDGITEFLFCLKWSRLISLQWIWLNLETFVMDSKFANFLIYQLNVWSWMWHIFLYIRLMKIDIDLVTSHCSLVRTHCSIRPLLLLLLWFLYWKYYMNLHKIKRNADILQLNYYYWKCMERKKYWTRSNG